MDNIFWIVFLDGYQQGGDVQQKKKRKKSLELVELTGSNLRAPRFVCSPSKLLQMLFMGSLPAGVFPNQKLKETFHLAYWASLCSH